MKHSITKSIFSMLLVFLGISTQAQTDLLIGHRGNDTDAQTSLIYADTTSGFSITETKTLTTDFVGPVNGIYGMALEPLSNKMYVVYGVASNVATERRLGILDISDASISDIGVVGAILDITFVDATLYASMGTIGDRKFGTLDLATGTFTEIFIHIEGVGGSAAINFDYYKNQILRSCQGSANYEIIDPITLTETSVPHGGVHPGWTTSLLTINATKAYSIGNTTVNVLNTDTYAYTSFGILAGSEYLHSSSFASYPVSLWVDGARKGCTGEVTLTVVGDGTTFEWYFNDVLIAGATASTYEPTESGSYYVFVDGVKTNPVVIELINIAAGFTMSDNPAYIGAGPTVDVDFFETATGAGLTYSWDSGAGATSADENPTFTYNAIGSYTVELTVTDASGTCENTMTQVLEVVGGVGIGELKVDFDLYPVPASNEITIQYAGAESYDVVLTDMNGAIISKHIISPKGKNIIDISELATGTYFLRISNGNQITNRKFMKK